MSLNLFELEKRKSFQIFLMVLSSQYCFLVKYKIFLRFLSSLNFFSKIWFLNLFQVHQVFFNIWLSEEFSQELMHPSFKSLIFSLNRKLSYGSCDSFCLVLERILHPFKCLRSRLMLCLVLRHKHEIRCRLWVLSLGEQQLLGKYLYLFFIFSILQLYGLWPYGFYIHKGIRRLYGWFFM